VTRFFDLGFDTGEEDGPISQIAISADLAGQGEPLGAGRWRVAVEAAGPLGSPLWASPRALGFVRAVLGEDCVLAGLAAVIELDGAPAGPLERAHAPLLADRELPCHAVVRVLPLGDAAPRLEVVAGSHRPPFLDGPAAPVAGACFLDSRLWFRRAANPTTLARATLELTYARPWFYDGRAMPSLRMSRAAYEGTPPEARRLLLRVGSALRQLGEAAE
jgi:hypothetical protein